MGLTVHYGIKASGKADNVRNKLELIAKFAQTTNIKKVYPIELFTGPRADFRNHADERTRWLLIQATGCSGKPEQVIAMTIIVGPGCEPMNIGFVKYENKPGWQWHSFCKTQYASNPECGGTLNFLKCHTSVIAILDFMSKLKGLRVTVSDEGDFWKHRNLELLATEVGEWNEMIAAAFGSLQTEATKQGCTLVAPITTYSNFDALAAEGKAKHGLDKN